MNTLPDKLFINLRKLGKIQKNGKISKSNDGIINLEGDYFYQPVKRFILGDSRKHSVNEINSIVNDTINTLYSMTHIHNDGSEEYTRIFENLVILTDEFERAYTGIENLRFTYASDSNISTQLDVILIKIRSTLKDTYVKINQQRPPYNNDPDLQLEPLG